MCQVPLAEPIEKESKILTDQHVTNRIVQSYFVWRKSCLLTALPTLFVGMTLGLYDLKGSFKDSALNGLGKILLLLTSFDSVFLFGAVLYAVMKWNYFPKSVMYVRLGFLVAFIMPLIPALFPLEMVIQGQYVDVLDNETIVAYKISFALAYALELLPVIITFPGGALRGSLRIRWLLPESTLSGWIIIMSAPFYSIVCCMALVLVMQVVGNALLFVGTLLIVALPWTYVILADLFVSSWDTEKKEKVQKVQRIVLIASITGYALILVWAFTAEVAGMKVIGGPNDNALLSYSSGCRIIVELIGRLLVTTVMFSDVILRMSLRNWTDSVQEVQSLDVEVGSKVEAFINVFGNPIRIEDASPTSSESHVDKKDTAKDVEEGTEAVNEDEVTKPKASYVMPSTEADV